MNNSSGLLPFHTDKGWLNEAVELTSWKVRVNKFKELFRIRYLNVVLNEWTIGKLLNHYNIKNAENSRENLNARSVQQYIKCFFNQNISVVVKDIIFLMRCYVSIPNSLMKNRRIDINILNSQLQWKAKICLIKIAMQYTVEYYIWRYRILQYCIDSFYTVVFKYWN